MKRTLKFVKDSDTRWYVVLPEWEGDRSALEMVAGADTMLDILAQGDHEVTVQVANEPLHAADMLQKVQPEKYTDSTEGADYMITSLKGVVFNLPVWLCDVNAYVWGEHPETIWIR